MFRKTAAFIFLVFPLIAFSQNASLKQHNLNKLLRTVAANSNKNIPRQINEDLTDKGYTVQGKTLINHIEVSTRQASQMQQNPKVTYFQLGASVCRDPNYISLLQQGATLSYQFTEVGTKKDIAKEYITAKDCGF